jgi:hypothetical protein
MQPDFLVRDGYLVWKASNASLTPLTIFVYVPTQFNTFGEVLTAIAELTAIVDDSSNFHRYEFTPICFPCEEPVYAIEFDPNDPVQSYLVGYPVSISQTYRGIVLCPQFGWRKA